MKIQLFSALAFALLQGTCPVYSLEEETPAVSSTAHGSVRGVASGLKRLFDNESGVGVEVNVAAEEVDFEEEETESEKNRNRRKSNARKSHRRSHARNNHRNSHNDDDRRGNRNNNRSDCMQHCRNRSTDWGDIRRCQDRCDSLFPEEESAGLEVIEMVLDRDSAPNYAEEDTDAEKNRNARKSHRRSHARNKRSNNRDDDDRRSNRNNNRSDCMQHCRNRSTDWGDIRRCQDRCDSLFPEEEGTGVEAIEMTLNGDSAPNYVEEDTDAEKNRNKRKRNARKSHRRSHARSNRRNNRDDDRRSNRNNNRSDCRQRCRNRSTDWGVIRRCQDHCDNIFQRETAMA